MTCKCCKSEVENSDLGVCESCQQTSIFSKADRYLRALDFVSKDKFGFYDPKRWKRLIKSLIRQSIEIKEFDFGSIDYCLEMCLTDGSKIFIKNVGQFQKSGSFGPIFATLKGGGKRSERRN